MGVVQLWATPKDSIPQHLSAEIRPDYNIISHYALRGVYTDGDALESALSAHLRYSFSLRKSNPLSEIYPTAYQGIGLGVYTLYHDNFTGTPMVAYLLQGARIADFTERLSLGYEWNLGASYGWKVNEVVGSRWNIYINVGLPFTWHANPKCDISFGPEYTHFSNGDTTFPNGGANTVGLRLGVTWKITPNGSAISSKSAGPGVDMTYHREGINTTGQGVDMANHGEGINTPGGDVTVGREIFHTNKDGEIFLFGKFRCKIHKSHAVMIGDADCIQTLGFGHGNDLLQIDEAVFGKSTFVKMHIN